MNSIERIEAYLAVEVTKDPMLYLNYLSDEKNIKDCYKYVFNKAMEQADKGECGVMIEDDDVYGWVKEYYNTPADEMPKSEPVVTNTPIIRKLEVPKKEVKTLQIHKSPKDNQLSLF